MRVLIFHGYLLRGTGSNIYNASLARALVSLGHEVHILCQDPAADALPFVDGERCTAYVPDIGGLLPVYVPDRYEGFEVKRFLDLSDAQLQRYIDANVEAVREIAERVQPDVALANHAVMGPAIMARAVGGRVPYAVKVHGSALEYVVRPDPGRFLPYALEGLRGAEAVLVGSSHMARVLYELAGDGELDWLRPKTRLGPPGVDAETFRPRPADEAAAGLRSLAGRLEGAAAASWGGDAGAAAALRALDPASDRIVSYVGKLIVSKGVDLLLAAWPLVVERVPGARLVIVGFGEYREGLERLAGSLAAGDLADAREVAARGRELEGGSGAELKHLAAFLDALEGERRSAYLQAAAAAFERVHWTGRLEHDDLPDLLAACEAQVVPSTFPEAFGMVAAEAAACGALPLSASHSGLAEVSASLAEALPEPLRPLLSFSIGPGAVEEIAEKLREWLSLDRSARASAEQALSDLARERYGWAGVARGVIAAASGDLAGLAPP